MPPARGGTDPQHDSGGMTETPDPIDARLAQLAGEVQKTRADLLGEARGTAERLRAMERGAGGLKTAIVIAAAVVVAVVIGAALALGQFLTGQMRVAIADAQRAAAVQPVPDAASPAPAPTPPSARATTAPAPRPLPRPQPAAPAGRAAPNTP